MHRKITNVKKQFTNWNKKVFGKVENEIKEKQQQLQDLQDSFQTIADVKKERELREEIENLMIREEIMWAQKARSDWIVQVDKNNRYFQTMVKQRRARSRILHLKVDEGSSIEGLKEIESTLVEHFKKPYVETNTKSVQTLLEELAVLTIPKIDQQQKDYLDIPVINAKIECVVYQLGPHKAPGPNGIPAFFY